MQRVNLFDGSDLGFHRFIDVIKWCSPCNTNSERLIPTLRAIIYLNGEYHCVLLKKNPTKLRTQCFIDELKPLFGLRKIGTNTIELDGVVRKKVKEYPWICSNRKVVCDQLGFPILQEETTLLDDFFIYDTNLYIHKLRTRYYVFSVATYKTKLIYANEINSYTTALSCPSLSDGSVFENDSDNENDDDDENEESCPSSSLSDQITNFYPAPTVKSCYWFGGAPGAAKIIAPPTNPAAPKRRGKTSQIVEQPNEHQQILYYELQKIFVFRALLELNFVYNKDAIFSPLRDFEIEERSALIPISINEFRFRNPNTKGRKYATAEEKFFFPETTTYHHVLNIMIVKSVLDEIEHVPSTYEILNLFSMRLLNLARLKFPSELYHCNKIIEKINNAFAVHNIMLSKL